MRIEIVRGGVPTSVENIKPSDAILESDNLLKGLDDLGINLTNGPKLRVYRGTNISDLQDIAELKNLTGIDNVQKNQWIISRLFHTPTIDVPHPALLDPFSNSELIDRRSSEWSFNSTSVLEAKMNFSGQPFHMVLLSEPNGESPYELTLVMPTRSKERDVTLDHLPPNFRSVGFSLDFLRNPNHRERISEFLEKRVAMNMVSGEYIKRSGIIGHQTPNGINTVSRLYLQAPDPFSYLGCYEVELFGPGDVGQGKERFLADTEEIVPESHWQEDEQHYCMIGDTESLTYPLLPIKELGKISTLSMEIHYDDKRDDPKLIRELLQGGFPLSFDGRSQWYATGYLGDGSVSLFYKPEWEENNARLVYRQKSDKRISPKEIHKTVVGLNALKTAITERLAA